MTERQSQWQFCGKRIGTSNRLPGIGPLASGKSISPVSAIFNDRAVVSS
jgi:hypothetical protein